MKRAPIVLTGTACGLVAVIGYHAASPQASALTTAKSATTPASASAAKSTTSTAVESTTSTAATTRSATGSDIQYQYGDLEVKVTMTGSRITDIALVRHTAYDPRSESIDQYAIPELRSEALSAQGANIDAVSGASYTSSAYEQSLQSAIDRLKA